MAKRMIHGTWSVDTNNVNIRTFLREQIPKQMQAISDEAIKAAFEDLGKQLLDLSRERAPMATGDLRKSAKVEVKKEQGKWIVTVSYGDEKVYYAFYVEYNMPSPPEYKNYTTEGTGPLFLTLSGDEVFSPDNIKRSLRKAFNKATK